MISSLTQEHRRKDNRETPPEGTFKKVAGTTNDRIDSECTICYSTPVIPFRLTFRPGISLYEQVVYAAKKAVISGQMRPGDPFPSVRALSKELKINPNTAHKVITHLIAEGLLE